MSALDYLTSTWSRIHGLHYAWIKTRRDGAPERTLGRREQVEPQHAAASPLRRRGRRTPGVAAEQHAIEAGAANRPGDLEQLARGRVAVDRHTE